MQNVKRTVRSGFLLLLSIALILPVVFATGAVAPAAVTPEIAEPFAAELAKIPSQTATSQPTITVEGNAVITPGKQLTGFFEVTVLVKTPAGQPLSQAAVTLKYDSAILTPVTWDETPAPIGPTSARQNVPVLTPHQNTVVNAAETYKGTEPDTGILTIKMTAADPGLVCTDVTAIAVVRFQYAQTKYPMLEATETAERKPIYVLASDAVTTATTAEWPAAGTNVKQRTVLYLASDVEARDGYLNQSVWYQAATAATDRPLNFYYYNGAPAISAATPTVSVSTTIGSANPYSIPNPNTVGAKVLSQKDGAATPSYTENLLSTSGATPTLVFTFVNKQTAQTGGAGVGGIMLLLYDWDNTLVGSKIIAEGDVKADVEQYVTANLVYPALKKPVGDLSRVNTYRGVYDADPIASNDQNIVSDGPKYPLTNKLDYAFATWQTAETVDDNNTPLNPADDVTYHTPDKTKNSYANGWARIPDGMAVEDVWTTFNVGELKDLDPDAAPVAMPATVPAGSPENYAYATQKESAYFHMVDFTKIGVLGGEPIPADKVLKVKAVYQEGVSLDKVNAYTITSAPVYDHINAYSAIEDGNAYSVSFNYERINTGRGVVRTRDPAVRITYVPDIESKAGSSFLMKGLVSNTDVMPVSFTPSAGIKSMTYMLGDVYGETSFATGKQRSDDANEAKVMENFNYAVFPYSKRLGSDGFVYRGTLRQILEAGTQAVQSKDRTKYDQLVTLKGINDLNLRETAEAPFTSATDAKNMIYDAIARGVKYGTVTGGVVDLDWHQLQYHILNFNWANLDNLGAANGIQTASNHIMTGGETGQCATAMNPKGFAWCRLDNCHGKGLGNGESGGIKDLLDLVTAANTGVDALVDLTTKGLTETFHLAESVTPLNAIDEPTFYTDATLGKAKTDLVTAVHAITAAGKSLESITWDMLQYQLDEKVFSADAGAYGKEHYWWFEGGQKVTDLPTLLAAAELSFGTTGLDGRNAPLNTATLAFLNQTFRPDLPGTEYTTKEAFIADVKSVVRLAHTAGKTLQDYTWDQLQFALINDRFGTAPEVATQSNASYWWKDGGKKVTDIPTFQQAMKREKEGFSANLNTATVEVVKNSLFLRGDFKGTEYTDTAPFVTKTKALVAASAKPESLTWVEIQYYIIHDVLAPGYYEAALEGGMDSGEQKMYWWANGDNDGFEVLLNYADTDNTAIQLRTDKLVEAVFRSRINGNPTALGQLVDIAEQYQDFHFYKGNSKTATDVANLDKFTDLADFFTQVEAVVKLAAVDTAEKPDGKHQVPKLTWFQIQDYLFTQTLKEDTAIVDKETVYWWSEKTNQGVKVTELTPMLAVMESYLESNNANDLTAETSVLKMKSTYVLKQKVNAFFNNANNARVMIKRAADAAKTTAYYDAVSGKLKLDWYQIQYSIINSSQIVAPSVAKAANYDWAPAWADSTVWPEFAAFSLETVGAMSEPMSENEWRRDELICQIQDAWEAYRLGQITLTEALRIDNNAQAELIKLEKLLTNQEITLPAETLPPGEPPETVVPETPGPDDETVIIMKHWLNKIAA